MVMQQLTQAMADKITLHHGEENLVPLSSGTASATGSDYSISLVVRVVVDRKLSVMYIRNNVLRLLHLVRGAELKILTRNLFMIKFNHQVDRKNALE